MTHAYAGHNPIGMWDMPQLIRVGHDSLVCGTWLRTQWYVGHDSSHSCGTWLIQPDPSETHDWHIRTWDITHSYMGHDSFTRGTWLIHTWDMTHLHVEHEPQTSEWHFWRIRVWDMTRSHVGRDSSTRGTWLIHTWNMTPTPQSDIADIFTCWTLLNDQRHDSFGLRVSDLCALQIDSLCPANGAELFYIWDMTHLYRTWIIRPMRLWSVRPSNHFFSSQSRTTHPRRILPTSLTDEPRKWRVTHSCVGQTRLHVWHASRIQCLTHHSLIYAPFNPFQWAL